MKFEQELYTRSTDTPDSGLRDWVSNNVYAPAANAFIQMKNGTADIVDPAAKAVFGTPLLGKSNYYDIAAPKDAGEYVTQTMSGALAQIVPYLAAAKLTGYGLKASVAGSAWEGALSRTAESSLGLSKVASRELVRDTAGMILGAAAVDAVKEPLHNETRLGNVLGGTAAFSTFAVLNPALAAATRNPLSRIGSRIATGALGGIAQYTTSSFINGNEITVGGGSKAAVSGATINTFLPAAMDGATKLTDSVRARFGFDPHAQRLSPPIDKPPQTGNGARPGTDPIFTGQDQFEPIIVDPSQRPNPFEDIFPHEITPNPPGIRVGGPSQFRPLRAFDSTPEPTPPEPNREPLQLPYYPEPGIEHRQLGPLSEQMTPETRYRGTLHSLRETVRDMLPEPAARTVQDHKLAYYLDEPGKIGEFMDAVRDKIKALEEQKQTAGADALKVDWNSLKDSIPKEILEANQEPQHKPVGPKAEWIDPEKDTAQSSEPEWNPDWGLRPGEVEEGENATWQNGVENDSEPKLVYDPNEEAPEWTESSWHHKEVGPTAEWLPFEERFRAPLKSLYEEVRDLQEKGVVAKDAKSATDPIDLRLLTFIEDPSHIGEFMDAVRDKANALENTHYYESYRLQHGWKEVEFRLPFDFFNREPQHRPIGPEQEQIKKPVDAADPDLNWDSKWGERPDKFEEKEWSPESENENGEKAPGSDGEGGESENRQTQPPEASEHVVPEDDPPPPPGNGPAFKPELQTLQSDVQSILPEKPATPLDWKLQVLNGDPSHVGDFMNAVAEKIAVLKAQAKAPDRTAAEKAGADALRLSASLENLRKTIPPSVVRETTTPPNKPEAK